jgi:ABC-type methionine transport system ATPase subunit
MSVEDNLSNSAIARELCIDPRTVANLLREATEEARQDTNLIFQKTLKARTNLLENLGKTLEKEGVSPHARAQLAHAVNSTLDLIDLLTGTRAPTNSRVAVSGHVKSP